MQDPGSQSPSSTLCLPHFRLQSNLISNSSKCGIVLSLADLPGNPVPSFLPTFSPLCSPTGRTEPASPKRICDPSETPFYSLSFQLARWIWEVSEDQGWLGISIMAPTVWNINRRFYSIYIERKCKTNPPHPPSPDCSSQRPRPELDQSPHKSSSPSPWRWPPQCKVIKATPPSQEECEGYRWKQTSNISKCFYHMPSTEDRVGNFHYCKMLSAK